VPLGVVLGIVGHTGIKLVEVYQPIVNEMVTSLDMAGCSLSLLWLDDELQALLDTPCASAAYTQC